MESWRMTGVVASIVICLLVGCRDADEETASANRMELGIAKWNSIFRSSDPVNDISIRSGTPIELYLKNPKSVVCQPVIPWPDHDDKLKLDDLVYHAQGPFKLEMITFHDETNIVFEVLSSYSLKDVSEEDRSVAFASAVEHFNRIYQACPDNPTEAEWVASSQGATCYCRLRLKNEHKDPRLIFSYWIGWCPREKTPEEVCAKLDSLTPAFLSGDVRELMRPDWKNFYLERIRQGKCSVPGSALTVDIKEPGLGFSVVVDEGTHRIAYAQISLRIHGSLTKDDALERFAQFSDCCTRRYHSLVSFNPPRDLTRFEVSRAWVRQSDEGDNVIVLGLYHDLGAWLIVALVFN